MKKLKIDAFDLLEKIRKDRPVIHHLTNWVTIYDCANVVKVLGGSPVMAHAPEEAAEMTQISSALVLNIGTLTVDLVEAMKIAAKSANKKGIPVVLDACGCGATGLRNQKVFEILNSVRVDIIKGNASEMATIGGVEVITKGVDSSEVKDDLVALAKKIAKERKCVAVITGKEDIVADQNKVYSIKNGHHIMANIVGTGCMATSVIGTFASVEKDLALAAVSGLVCFEVASECAQKGSVGPGTFKEKLFDCLYHLDKKTVDKMQKVEC